jgi:hypothetical protein
MPDGKSKASDCKKCNPDVKIPLSISPDGESSVTIKTTGRGFTWDPDKCGLVSVTPSGTGATIVTGEKNYTITGQACTTITVTANWSGGSKTQNVQVRRNFTLATGVDTSKLDIASTRADADNGGKDFYGKHNCDPNNPNICDVYSRSCGDVPRPTNPTPVVTPQPTPEPRYNYCCVDNGLPLLSSDVMYLREQKSKSCPDGYTLLEISEKDCVKPTAVAGSCQKSTVEATPKNVNTTSCEGPASLQIDDGQKCTNVNSDKVENSFYKIACTKTINSKFDYGNDNSDTTTRSLYSGEGINFAINVNTTYNCSYEFYDGIWNKTYNSVLTRVEAIDKNLVSYVKKGDSTGFEKYIKTLSKVGVNNTKKLYELWNTVVDLKTLINDYSSYVTKNVYNENATVTITTKEKGANVSNKFSFIQVVNNKGKETKKVTKTMNLVNGTKVENFTLNNTSNPRKVTLLPKKSCIKNDGTITGAGDNGSCPSGTIDGGNKMYIGINTDKTENGNKYPMSIVVGGLGSNNSTITNNKCDIQIKDDDITYRQIDVGNPFINNTWKKGVNWINTLYDFTQIIHDTTWSETPYKVIELNAKEILAIRESNSKFNKLHPYLGLCDRVKTESQDEITKKICSIIK